MSIASSDDLTFGAPLPRSGDVESVARAMHVLRVLASCNDGGIRFSDLGDATGLSNATLHRLLQTMIHEGFVEQNAVTRLYHLGFSFLELGAAAVNRYNLRDFAHASLQRIARSTGDTVFLCVRSYFDSVVIDRVEGSYPIKSLAATIGTRRPLGVGSGALALLSFMPEGQRKEIIQRNALRQDVFPELAPAVLQPMIEEARAKGYVFLDNSIIKGMSAVSVVIKGSKKEPLAAISVSATSERLAAFRRASIVEELRKEARRIENARAGEPGPMPSA